MSRRKPRPRIYSPRLWGHWLLVGAAWLLARLPLRLLLTLGKGLGLAAWHLARRRRRITEINLALCFPASSEVERTRLARQSFIHTGLSVAEMMTVWLNPRRRLDERFTLEGVEALRRARAEGRGVILLGGHLSSMDVASGPVTARVPVDIVYRENKNPVWEWLQVHGRGHYFDAQIERDDTRRILRRLKSGHVVWYAADQDYGPRHSVFVPFFGVPAATITATGRLARFNASPVVFLTQFRDETSMTWRVRLERLDDFPSGDDAADAARFNRLIEAAVAAHPEQYLWAHRRFKTRPPGQPSPYA